MRRQGDTVSSNFWHVWVYIFTACDYPVMSRIYFLYSTRVANVCPSVAETNTDKARDTNKTGHLSYAQFSNASQWSLWKNALQWYQHFAFNLIISSQGKWYKFIALWMFTLQIIWLMSVVWVIYTYAHKTFRQFSAFFLQMKMAHKTSSSTYWEPVTGKWTTSGKIISILKSKDTAFCTNIPLLNSISITLHRRVSSVDIAMDYRLDGRGSFLTKAKNVSLFHGVQTGSAPTPPTVQ
jgi:hypothetical protein